MKPRRVGIVALLHESNTFVRQATTLEHFRQDLLATGHEVVERMADSPHEVGGFLEGLDSAGIQAVPILAARAYPSGVISDETFRRLLEMMLKGMDDAGPLDGLLVAPHGATVNRSWPDADGHWLNLLRERLGPDRPIVGTLDLHANLSPAMVRACDALVAYRTNPHLDQRERGVEAARLIARTLSGEIRPAMVAARPPMIVDIQSGATTEGPCAELLVAADEALRASRALSTSVLHGFPYADVPEMGSATIVVTDGDSASARRVASELAEKTWSLRRALPIECLDVPAALDRAACLSGPVCLLDMGDNVGGGSPGDGTHLAAEIQRRGLPDAFVCLADTQAVQSARAAGAGRQVALRIGGKSDASQGEPLAEVFTVVSLHDGRFDEPETRHGGYSTFDQGPTAVVRSSSGLTVMITSRRMVPFSLRQLTSCGLDPATFRYLVAKGVNAPIAAYCEVCGEFLRVNTPGSTCADVTRLSYRYRRRPMFPFEPDTTWDAADEESLVLGKGKKAPPIR